MIKLYKRCVKFIADISALDCYACPDFDKYEHMINEAKDILIEIKKIE